MPGLIGFAISSRAIAPNLHRIIEMAEFTGERIDDVAFHINRVREGFEADVDRLRHGDKNVREVQASAAAAGVSE